MIYQLRSHSFVQKSSDELEAEYDNLREQSFTLKYHGKLSIFEQAFMIAEERVWWINRLNKEIENQNKANSGSSDVPKAI